MTQINFPGKFELCDLYCITWNSHRIINIILTIETIKTGMNIYISYRDTVPAEISWFFYYDQELALACIIILE